VPYAVHRLDPATWLNSAVRYLVGGALQERMTQQSDGSGVQLADGRTARSIAVLPVLWAGRTIAALVVVRAESPFTAADAGGMSRVGELVGLELAVSHLLQQTGTQLATPPTASTPNDDLLREAKRDRQQAIALYELSRLALAGGGMEAAPNRAARIIADTLGYDVVGVWLQQRTGWLELAGSKGYGPDTALALPVTEDPRRSSPAQNAIVAPIGSDGETVGMLLLGRTSAPLGEADHAMAPLLGECLAYLRPAQHDAPLALAGTVAPPLGPEDAVTVAGPGPESDPDLGSETAPQSGGGTLVVLAALVFIVLTAAVSFAAITAVGPVGYVVATAAPALIAWVLRGGRLLSWLLGAAAVVAAERAAALAIAGSTDLVLLSGHATAAALLAVGFAIASGAPRRSSAR